MRLIIEPWSVVAGEKYNGRALTAKANVQLTSLHNI